ncbi:hypothetical protein GOBAR_AA11384 [Gossypium barbadense]|uniref:Uncharacterized protein n=1 Tax=Gossypium barbadense TaxID=3634 RepID=A0A2P5Y0Y8_GOSBA|nr:hypothetical protein GOBAR_AA11384 [Gossypium barbadense]
MSGRTFSQQECHFKEQQEQYCILDQRNTQDEQLIVELRDVFNAATMVTKRVTDEWDIHAFITGTSHQHLRYIIIGKTSTKLSHLYEMVDKFSKGDEVGKVCIDFSTQYSARAII